MSVPEATAKNIVVPLAAFEEQKAPNEIVVPINRKEDLSKVVVESKSVVATKILKAESLKPVSRAPIKQSNFNSVNVSSMVNPSKRLAEKETTLNNLSISEYARPHQKKKDDTMIEPIFHKASDRFKSQLGLPCFKLSRE